MVAGSRGYTLIEVIVAVVIIAVLAMVSARYVITTAEGYVLARHTSMLVSQARLAIDRVGGDLRMAAPNSIRLDVPNCIEFLPVRAVSRYLNGEVHGTSSTSLIFPLFDTVLGLPGPQRAGSTAQQTTLGGENVRYFSIIAPEGENVTKSAGVADGVAGASYVLINPSNAADIYIADAVPGAGVQTLATIKSREGLLATNVGTTDAVIRDVQLSDQDHFFASHSAERRVFFVGNPVSYCVVDEKLFRYSNYGLNPSQVQPPAATGVAVSHDINGFDFSRYYSDTYEDNDQEFAQFSFDFLLRGVAYSVQHEVPVRYAP